MDGEETSDFRRRTKIVATLGPATDNAEALESLILAGADVLRFNFSHGAAHEQKERVERVRTIAAKVGRHVGIMGDLQGPKIRIESFKSGSVVLETGQEFLFDTALGFADGDETQVGVAYPDLVKDPKQLASAIARQQYVTTRILIRRGADPDAVTAAGTPLHLAIVVQHTGIATLLLEAGANPNLGKVAPLKAARDKKL